jgi:signal transduction histidine kinase
MKTPIIDPRIEQLRNAALAMKEGNFEISLPVDSNQEDSLTMLGNALGELGKSMEKRFAELEKLARVTEQINAGLVLDEILEHLYESFQTIIPYDRIGVALLNQQKTELEARWLKSEKDTIHLGPGYKSPMAGSSLEKILRTGMPRILNDLENYLENNPSSESTSLVFKEGMRSSLTCPLIANGKPIGFIFFSSGEKDTYRHAHVETYRRIAGQLSVIVEKGRLYEELLELNQLKNKFLGIAAHDLRNPLSIISGYTTMMLAGTFGSLNGEFQETIKEMKDASDEMLFLISDLLDVSAIESGRLDLSRQPVHLANFLTHRLERNRMMANSKSISIESEISDNLPEVFIDKRRMEQVINNLISNALKFSHENTIIVVGANRANGFVEVFVQDQGQGIPDDELPNLFTEFGRTSVEATNGEPCTGLGLCIVKKIVEAHGGSISVASEVNVGSTFQITIPVL